MRSVPEQVPDKIFDPYTGELKASFPTEPTSRPDSRRPSAEIARQVKEVDSADVWSHLSHIRELQGELSRMHLQMEGIGAHGRNVHRRNRSKVDILLTSDTGEVEDRDEDFHRLAGRFKGREEEIDKMMEKLNALADAVTDFHQLQMPKVHVDPGVSLKAPQLTSRSRSGTESRTLSPLRSPPKRNSAPGKSPGLDTGSFTQLDRPSKLTDSPASMGAGTLLSPA